MQALLRRLDAWLAGGALAPHLSMRRGSRGYLPAWLALAERCPLPATLSACVAAVQDPFSSLAVRGGLLLELAAWEQAPASGGAAAQWPPCQCASGGGGAGAASAPSAGVVACVGGGALAGSGGGDVRCVPCALRQLQPDTLTRLVCALAAAAWKAQRLRLMSPLGPD